MKKILEFSGFLEKKDRELRVRQQEALESFHKAAADDAQCHTMASGIAMLAAGGKYIETLAEDKEFVKWMDDSCANWDKKFMDKYGQKIQAAPDMPVPRIQYFCRMLMELMPQVENVRMDDEWLHAMSEFGELFICYVQEAEELWCDADKEAGRVIDGITDVLPLFRPAPEDSIADVKNALAYILSARPDRKDIKYRILLGTTMLFFAYEGMSDLELEVSEKMRGRD